MNKELDINRIEVTMVVSLDEIVIDTVKSRLQNGEVIYGEYRNGVDDGSHASHIITGINSYSITFITLPTYWGKLLRDSIINNDEFQFIFDSRRTVSII